MRRAAWCVVLALGTVCAADAVPAGTARIDVHARGFRNQRGVAVVAVYASADGWFKIARAVAVRRVPVTGAAVDVGFEDLPAGRLAVAVIHDENRNDKVDMRWFPFPHPDEGVGVSRNPASRFGPPKFDEAAVTVGADPVRVEVDVVY